MDNQSEVARLLQQIKLSYESAQLALSGSAMVASHEFITKHMENMEESRVALTGIVGSDEAIKLFTETLEDV
jgi:hypothetical protein